MAEQQKPKSDSVLTDKDKFKENPDKEKLGHMGDKPSGAQEQRQPKK
jgi:hypothetical protein